MIKNKAEFETPLTLKRLSGINNSKDTIRIVTFHICNYLFGLAVESVNKIIPCPALNLNFQEGVSAIDLEEQTITIIDLRFQFSDRESKEEIASSQSENCLLILIQTITGENCGILIEKAPLIVEVPLKNIRPVPLSYGEIGKLSFVSHMAILSEGEAKETVKIFLLGMNQIIARKAGIPLPKTSLLTAETEDNKSQQRFLRIIFGTEEGLLPMESVCCTINLAIEEIYPTPALPEWILGVYYWNEQMLRLIDLDCLMGYSPVLLNRSHGETPIAVVLKLHDLYFGFIIAKVFGVESHELDKMQSIDDRFCPTNIQHFVRGSFDKQRWVLDVDQLYKILRSLGN